jgi:hypothetical protein
MRRLLPSDDFVPSAEDLPLFAAPEIPPAPSGPATPLPEPSAGTLEGYQAWRATGEGQRAFDYMERMALEAFQDGERRIGAKGLLEACRFGLRPRVKLNSTHTAYIADELVAKHPVLADKIERRKRKSA